MNTYENPFGLGYERATEPGPEVELKNSSGIWQLRIDPMEPLGHLYLYRRPIKLQVGHRYALRSPSDSMLKVVDVLLFKNEADVYDRYLCSDGRKRAESGRFFGHDESCWDLVTHIEEPETKEEPMKDTVTVNNVAMTYAQIEAAHAEMMRQKAEKEFKLGDIVRIKGFNVMFIASQKREKTYSTGGVNYYSESILEKVTGTPEFMAQLRAVLEGK